MKATLTCEKLDTCRFEVVAEIESSEKLVDYEGVLDLPDGLEVFGPSDCQDDKIRYVYNLNAPVEVGEIAIFTFTGKTATGAVSAGDTCEVK